MPSQVVTTLECSGCGATKRGVLPFRCGAADAGDDVDHLLRRPVPGAAGTMHPELVQPLLQYREFLASWQLARRGGLSDAQYVALALALDERVAAIEGHGFVVTPYVRATALGDGVWVKNETGNVGGSHKARHLAGIALHLLVAEALGLTSQFSADAPLAIASCGNAALAAGVMARALDRSLRVFIPPWADATIMAKLRAYGAELVVCERRPQDPPGDPCVRAFRAAVDRGAVPFSCQGTDNGLTVEGCMTLGWELLAQHSAIASSALDRVFIQVGGAALASAVCQALDWAHAFGQLERLPAIHCVQVRTAQPLVRAWRRVADDIAGRLGVPSGASDADLATTILVEADERLVAEALAVAASNRSRYMSPEAIEPRSIATGILDDEAYDWHAVVSYMIRSGGWPVAVHESELQVALARGRAATSMDVDATGTAGLAGLLSVRESGRIAAGEQVALLFTGARR